MKKIEKIKQLEKQYDNLVEKMKRTNLEENPELIITKMQLKAQLDVLQLEFTDRLPIDPSLRLKFVVDYDDNRDDENKFLHAIINKLTEVEAAADKIIEELEKQVRIDTAKQTKSGKTE